jgi:hypothetical protein
MPRKRGKSGEKTPNGTRLRRKRVVKQQQSEKLVARSCPKGYFFSELISVARRRRRRGRHERADELINVRAADGAVDFDEVAHGGGVLRQRATPCRRRAIPVGRGLRERAYHRPDLPGGVVSIGRNPAHS